MQDGVMAAELIVISQTLKMRYKMKKILSFFFPLLLVVLLVSGCATSGVKEMSNTNLTAGKVKMEIKKGVTTQAEILQIFGSPNI